MKKVVVIGGGLMGSSVAWKLAERGEHVLLLEQQGKDFTNGSSYGAARIARSLGPKKDVFSYVHNKTIKEVRQLIEFLNDQSSSQKHKMEDIYSTSPVSYLYHRDQWEAISKLRYKKQKYDYRRGSGDSAFRKFGMTIPQDMVMVREFRKFSGTINPTALIKKLRLGITEKGGQIRYNRKVVQITKKNGVFLIDILHTKTNKTKTIEAEKVIVAAGPYTIGLLKNFAPYLDRVITPKRVALSFFKIKKDRYNQLSEKEKQSILDAHPMFSQIGREYFSLIEQTNKNDSPIIKAGGHQMRRNINDLDRVWEDKPRKKELKWIKKQFRKHIEMLEIYLKKKDIETVDHYNCVYSNTRSGIPLVTPIMNKFGSVDQNLIIIAGMSGVGAKGCLGYATIGADLVTGKSGKPSKIYRKAVKAFGNPKVRLYTRRPRRGRLF